MHALSEFGIRDIKVPATRPIVWQAIDGARAGHGAKGGKRS
jgi:hypothetical protein